MDKPGKRNKKKEEHVEDIYGVHFKYQDLFNRLLKVQKERNCSDPKSSLNTMSSFDSNIKRNNSAKPKSIHATLQKRSISGVTSKPKPKLRKSSVKKSSTRHLKETKNLNIFKSFSPTRAANALKKSLKLQKPDTENKKALECKLRIIK